MDQILCKQITDRLKLLSDAYYIDDESFLKVVSKTNSILKSSMQRIVKDGSEETVAQNVALSTLLLLMTETCRHGLDATELDNLLKEHNFSNQRTELLIKLYDSVKSPLTVELDSIGNHLPHIVGANWSLDYHIKESGGEHVTALEFLVDLETQGVGGSESNLLLACSLDEMDDLVASLKDATKLLDKLASG